MLEQQNPKNNRSWLKRCGILVWKKKKTKLISWYKEFEFCCNLLKITYKINYLRKYSVNTFLSNTNSQ